MLKNRKKVPLTMDIAHGYLEVTRAYVIHIPTAAATATTATTPMLPILTRAKVAQTFGSGRIIVLKKSLMKRLESALLEQINYEKARKLFT